MNKKYKSERIIRSRRVETTKNYSFGNHLIGAHYRVDIFSYVYIYITQSVDTHTHTQVKPMPCSSTYREHTYTHKTPVSHIHIFNPLGLGMI